jgi:hypothetical protein
MDRKPLSSAAHAPPQTSLNRTRLGIAISYASFSGILSGMCLLFAKSGVELLLLTLQGKNQFWRWQAWMLVLGLVIFALLQLWYLHKALIMADPTLVCPCEYLAPDNTCWQLIAPCSSGFLLLQPVLDCERVGLF